MMNLLIKSKIEKERKEAREMIAQAGTRRPMTMRLPLVTIDQIKEIAEKEGISQSDVVRVAVHLYLKNIG